MARVRAVSLETTVPMPPARPRLSYGIGLVLLSTAFWGTASWLSGHVILF